MPDSESEKPRRRPWRVGVHWVGPILMGLGGVVVVLTIVGVLVVLDHLTKAPDHAGLSALEVYGLVAAFIGGLVVGAGLLTLALVLELVRKMAAGADLLAAFGSGGLLNGNDRNRSTSRRGPTTEVPEPAFQEMLGHLRDLRDNSLLSAEQKRAKLDRLTHDHRRRLAADVEALVAKGEFHLAVDRVADLEKRFGADPDSRRLHLEIEKAQQQTEQEDLREATQRIEDFLGVSAWPRAEGVARELIERHPDSAAARELANRIQRERQRAEHEQERTAYAEIQQFTSRREWKHALGAARAFVERYPRAPETAALRGQLETLEANAEIAERHAAETQLKEMVKERRYGKAVDLALEIIRKYPDSPQAEALKSQLPRLEARAQAEEAGKA